MNPKQILLDLQKELSGELLEDTVDIRGRKITFRLLNEAETGWVYGFVNVGTMGQASMLLSARLAMLAVGIKAIDGVTVEELFAETWDSLDEIKKSDLLSSNAGKKKFAIASMFMDTLSEYPPTFISDLQDAWKLLEERRNEAQREVKNS
jgi:hypothetical protein